MAFAIFAAIVSALFYFKLLVNSYVLSSHEQAGDRCLVASSNQVREPDEFETA